MQFKISVLRWLRNSLVLSRSQSFVHKVRDLGACWIQEIGLKIELKVQDSDLDMSHLCGAKFRGAPARSESKGIFLDIQTWNSMGKRLEGFLAGSETPPLKLIPEALWNFHP